MVIPELKYDIKRLERAIERKLKEVEKIEDIKKLCMKDFIYYD